MNDTNIRGTEVAPSLSSRMSSDIDASMKQERQELRADVKEVVTWLTEFFPTILEDDPLISGCVSRDPKWYVLRYAFQGETLLRRVLNMVKMEHTILQYEQEQPRGAPTIRAHLPGFMFLNFDMSVDRWQQIIEFPHVIELLGSPNSKPPGIIGKPRPLPSYGEYSMEGLRLKLPYRRKEKVTQDIIRSGCKVRITKGAYRMFTCAVSEVNWFTQQIKGDVTIFGRPSTQTFNIADVELVRK